MPQAWATQCQCWGGLVLEKAENHSIAYNEDLVDRAKETQAEIGRRVEILFFQLVRHGGRAAHVRL